MIVNLFVFLQNITSAQKSVADRKICQYETLIKFDDVTVLMISAGNGQSESLKWKNIVEISFELTDLPFSWYASINISIQFAG